MRGVSSTGSMPTFLKDRFGQLNFDAKDIPKAIIIHEFLGIAMLFVTWTLCYRLQPSQSPFFRARAGELAKLIPQKFSTSMSSINIPFIDKNFISSRFGTSYIESSCLRKLIRPITLPGKVVLTYKLVRALSLAETKLQQPSDQGVSPVSHGIQLIAPNGIL